MSKKPAYGDWLKEYKSHTPKPRPEIKNPSKLKNELYTNPLNAYLMCTTLYLEQFTIPEMLEKQLNRLDVDTICGFELYQMKQIYLNTDALEYKSFLPKTQ